jgi:hypothetical protein
MEVTRWKIIILLLLFAACGIGLFFYKEKDEELVYIEPEPVYIEPEPVYIEPEPVYIEPEPVYIEPEPEEIIPIDLCASINCKYGTCSDGECLCPSSYYSGSECEIFNPYRTSGVFLRNWSDPRYKLLGKDFNKTTEGACRNYAVGLGAKSYTHWGGKDCYAFGVGDSVITRNSLSSGTGYHQYLMP